MAAKLSPRAASGVPAVSSEDAALVESLDEVAAADPDDADAVATLLVVDAAVERVFRTLLTISDSRETADEMIALATLAALARIPEEAAPAVSATLLADAMTLLALEAASDATDPTSELALAYQLVAS